MLDRFSLSPLLPGFTLHRWNTRRGNISTRLFLRGNQAGRRRARFFACIAVILLLAVSSLQVQSKPRVKALTALPIEVEQPTAVTVGPDRTLYIVDASQRILAFGPNGQSRVLVSTDLHHPLDLRWIDDGLWVADTGQQRLLRYDGDGRLQQSIDLKPPPCPEDKPQCQFPAPEPVALASVDEILFWADRRSHHICRLQLPEGKPLGCFGGRGEEPGQFQYPFQLAIDRDKFLHGVDILNARLQIFDKDGRFFRQQGRFGFGHGELFRPNGMAIQTDRDRLFVSDGYFGTISVFDQGKPQGVLLDSAGRPLRFDSPTGLAFAGGQLYVAETGGNKIWRLVLDEADVAEPAVSPADPPSFAQKNCLLCHLEWASQAPAEICQADEQGISPVASLRMCYSCHNGPVMDSRLAIGAGAQHPVIYEPKKDKRRHAKLWPRKEKLPKGLFPLTEDHQLTCVSCHTPHEDSPSKALYPGHRNAWLRVPNPDGQLCERCHESKAESARERQPRRKGLNHPLGFHLAKPPFQGAADYSKDPNLQRGLPDTLANRGASLNQHGQMICQSCHQIHGGVGQNLLILDDNKGQLCRQCHRRQFSHSKQDARSKGVHPVNIKPDEEMKRNGKKVEFITCNSCHPVHEGKPGTPMLLKPAPELCHDCHQRQHAKGKDEARTKGVHPVNFDLDDPVTLKGKQVKRVDCLTCHAVHHGKPNTPALVEDHHNGQLCRTCHEDNLPVLGSDHDLRISAKESQNRLEETPTQSGLCGACHTLHRGKGEWPFLYAAAIVDDPSHPSKEEEKSEFKRDQLCLNCHQDHTNAVGKEKFIEYFSHPHEQIILRSDKDRMPLLGQDESDQDFGAIGCTTCHDPHVWQPGHRNQKRPPLAENNENLAGDPHSSFLRITQPTQSFCLNCHGQDTRVKFLYFHDPENARGKVDYLQ